MANPLLAPAPHGNYRWVVQIDFNNCGTIGTGVWNKWRSAMNDCWSQDYFWHAWHHTIEFGRYIFRNKADAMLFYLKFA